MSDQKDKALKLLDKADDDLRVGLNLIASTLGPASAAWTAKGTLISVGNLVCDVRNTIEKAKEAIEKAKEVEE